MHISKFAAKISKFQVFLPSMIPLFPVPGGERRK
jgi:hypothetical protein